MNSLELKARAKINLSLDVLRKRPDGYHDLKMLMQTIELHDSVFLEKADKGVLVICDSPSVPEDRGNIAYKAADLLIKQFNISKGIKIKIEKRIPVAAGLAGGSSNAAAVLKGMNLLFDLGIDDNTLGEYGKSLGADIPYCLRGGTMLAEGIGEVLTPLPPLNGINILLVKPAIDVSTTWVYKNLDLGKIKSRPDTEVLVNAVKGKDIDLVARNMVNVLETVTSEQYGIINEIKRRLLEQGALGSLMSGSGPSVFGIFKDAETMEKAFHNINKNWSCHMTKTLCEER